MKLRSGSRAGDFPVDQKIVHMHEILATVAAQRASSLRGLKSCRPDCVPPFVPTLSARLRASTASQIRLAAAWQFGTSEAVEMPVLQ
jgi:hypothetical protein